MPSVRSLLTLLVMLSASSWAQKDLYEVLGVARDATPRQIKRAYHKVSPSVATCADMCVTHALTTTPSAARPSSLTGL